MSVRQNMGYGLKIAGLAKDRIAEKVAEAARLLELDGVAGQKAKATVRRPAPACGNGAGDSA